MVGRIDKVEAKRLRILEWAFLGLLIMGLQIVKLNGEMGYLNLEWACTHFVRG